MFTNFSKFAFSAVAVAIVSGLPTVSLSPNLCFGQASEFNSEAAVAEFDQAAAKWRETVTEINVLTIQYQNADASEASALRRKHREQEVKARLQFRDLFEIALKIVQQSPESSDEATQFLLMATFYRFNNDKYELTGEAAEALIPVTKGGRGLPEIAGVSYWATNQYEKAMPFLEEAFGMGLLDEKNRAALPTVDLLKNAWEGERAKLAAEAAADDLPRVRLKTTRGDIVLELFENEAPNTVANFIRLVESGGYRNVPFYQVLSAQVALAGDTRVTPANLGFALPDENQSPEARRAFRGRIAMAKLPMPEGSEFVTFPNSASSHFFITFRPIFNTSAEHTIFGRIVEGIEHFSALKRIDPNKEKKEGEPEEMPDYILEAEVVRKRDHAYEPNRIELSEANNQAVDQRGD